MGLPLLVGITGASGVIYGVELLKVLRELEQPAHLIMSRAAERNLALETEYDPAQVQALAQAAYEPENLAAPPASGSFRTQGMIIAPCSIKTLSAVANSYDADLLVRAADVTLKERRPLVLMVRETPLHKGHLRLMAQAADLGAVILPPVPAFYHRPRSIEDILRQSVGKALDALGLEHDLYRRWAGA
ncbi:MAG: UbiX family flavin prenyltransferase [Thermodesulfobacteriota bacterium]